MKELNTFQVIEYLIVMATANGDMQFVELLANRHASLAAKSTQHEK